MKTAVLMCSFMCGVLAFASAAAGAENCAQTYGGNDQDKLIQNLSTCSQDVRASRGGAFTAYLDRESCRISVHAGKGDFHNLGTRQLIECMGQYGWKIPFESCDINE